jgi:hypothetical protein
MCLTTNTLSLLFLIIIYYITLFIFLERVNMPFHFLRFKKVKAVAL